MDEYELSDARDEYNKLLEWYRKNRNITIQQLADRIGVTRQVLDAFRNNRNHTALGKIQRFIDARDFPLELYIEEASEVLQRADEMVDVLNATLYNLTQAIIEARGLDKRGIELRRMATLVLRRERDRLRSQEARQRKQKGNSYNLEKTKVMLEDINALLLKEDEYEEN